MIDHEQVPGHEPNEGTKRGLPIPTHVHDQGRTIGILSSLLLNFVVMIVLVSGTILVVSIMGSAKVAEDLSKSYMSKVGDATENKLDAFFQPISKALRQAQDWAKSGVLKPENAETFNALFFPLLKSYPQITSLCSGAENGFSNRLGEDPEGFISRINYAGDSGKKADFALFNKDQALVKSWSEDDSFDARKRDWYMGAMDAFKAAKNNVKQTETFWTKAFVLHTSKNLGLAAALPFETNEGKTFIMTFNVMLSRISDFTSSLLPTPHGMVFVFDDEQNVIGLPADQRFSAEASRTAILTDNFQKPIKLTDLKLPILSLAATTWDKSSAIFPFESEGNTWWAQFRPYKLTKEKALWVGIIVPSDDFLIEAKRQQGIIIIVSLIALILAASMGIFMAQTYGHPLDFLAKQSERITTLDLSPGTTLHTHIAEFRQLADTQEHMRAALESFSCYIPMEVVKDLVRMGESAVLGGKMTEITIMFCDVEGFTTIAEAMGPEQLTNYLAEYFSEMMAIIGSEKGTIDKMIGDAIMAFWGAPLDNPKHGASAVKACLRCKAFLHKFNARCREQGKPPLHTRFGISTGKVMVGNFGSPKRMNYTALGDTVNLASRLEGINKQYDTEIIATEVMHNQAGDEFFWRLVDVVTVKGKHKPVKLYEPMGIKGEVSADDLAFAASYEAAFNAFQNREFGKVESLMKKARDLRPKDLSVTRVLESAAHYLKEPPSADWDGVTHMKTK